MTGLRPGFTSDAPAGSTIANRVTALTGVGVCRRASQTAEATAAIAITVATTVIRVVARGREAIGSTGAAWLLNRNFATAMSPIRFERSFSSERVINV